MKRKKILGKLPIKAMTQSFQTPIEDYQSELNRLKFEELADLLPIIKENEQNEYIGGAYVYGDNGTFISNSYLMPDPSSIYVLRVDETYYFGCFPVSIYSSTPIPLSQSSANERENIVQSIANSLGIYGVNFQTVHANGPTRYGDCSSSGSITIYTGSNLFNNCNYWEIVSVLMHEQYHQNHLSSHATIQNEIDSILAGINHSGYTFCSLSFINSMLNKILKLEYFKNTYGYSMMSDLPVNWQQ